MSEAASETPAEGGKGKNRRKKAGDEKVFRRTELVAVVADKAGLPRNKAQIAVDAVFDVMGAQLKTGQEVRLAGFGSFVVRDRKAGKGRDPRTGAEIDIPESKSVRFRPGKSLKESLAT